MTTLAFLLASTTLAAAPAVTVDEATVLKTLRAERPRLMATAADAARLKKQIASDPRTAQFYAEVRKQADRYLKEKPVEHKIIGPRLLGESRKCLDRVFTLATVYRIERRPALPRSGDRGDAHGGRVQGLEPVALPRHGRDDQRPGHRLRLALRAS